MLQVFLSRGQGVSHNRAKTWKKDVRQRIEAPGAMKAKAQQQQGLWYPKEQERWSVKSKGQHHVKHSRSRRDSLCRKL